MRAEGRLLWLVSIGVVLAALVVIGLFWAREELAPELHASWVAIEVEGSGVARAGRVAISAGTRCTLHAVLEARRRDGSILYYTEAPALELDGVVVDAADIEPWTREGRVDVLWFTVDGLRPYAELDSEFQAADLRFADSFRADWPRAWSVPARLQPSSESYAQGMDLLDREFGTQRFHVRIELYESRTALTPRQRFASPGASALPAAEASFPTLVASLPGALATASRVFGLAQLEPEDRTDERLRGLLAGWSADLLAFSRRDVLQALLVDSGVGIDSVRWQLEDLAEGPTWSAEGVAPGDLARVGERVVVLVADRGAPGVLDRDDLCFDYKKGAAVRSLGEVFIGDGLVELGALR